MRYLVATIIIGAALQTTTLQKADAHGWHDRVKKVCANRILNKPKWKKGHYAIAQGVDGLHCSWKWNAATKRYAEAQAMRACKSRGHARCKIVESK